MHHTVDDTPFGGGPGMVMKPDVWGDALDASSAEPVGRSICTATAPDTSAVPIRHGGPRLVVPTPSGVPFTQEMAAAYAAGAASGVRLRAV